MPLQCPIKPGESSSYILQRKGRKGKERKPVECVDKRSESIVFTSIEHLSCGIYERRERQRERQRETTWHCTSSAMIAIREDPRDDACAATPAMAIDGVCDSVSIWSIWEMAKQNPRTPPGTLFLLGPWACPPAFPQVALSPPTHAI